MQQLSPEAITKLTHRVGWAQVLQPYGSGLSVGAEALKSDSLRTFDAFHKLATAENVFASIPNPKADTQADFDKALNDLRTQAVLKVVHRVFVINPKALYGTDAYGNTIPLSGTDYSGTAIQFAPMFDNAIGYQVAIDVVEQLISSPRINAKQRAADMAIDVLKIDLNGATDGAGTRVDNGLVGRLNAAIKSISDALFYTPASDSTPKIVDVSDLW